MNHENHASHVSPPWRITLLGNLRATAGEQAITRFKTQKNAALLAYLAYHLRQMHAREVVAGVVWPEAGPRQGRNNLSVALSSLRHQLEPPGTPANSVLRADRFSVGLNPDAVTTDVGEFEAALKGADGARGGAAEQIDYLTRALDLHQGRLLPGYYEGWIAGEQERLAGLFGAAVGRLVALLEGDGDAPSALNHVRRAVALDPFREDAQWHLIRLLGATGQAAAALRQYREFERLLGEELGDEPSAALRALALRIEREATAGVTPAATPPHAPAAQRQHPPAPAPPSRPEGLAAGTSDTVTFLMTGVDGMPPQRQGDTGDAPYRQTLERQRALLRAEFARHGGREIRAGGDSFLVAFASAAEALACATAAQRALAEQDWPDEGAARTALRVRMALHSGDVERGGPGEYRGPAPHWAGTLLLAAHGGQILASAATAALARGGGGEVRLADLGVFRLRDAPDAERLFQVEYPGQPESPFPPPRALAGYKPSLPQTFTRFFGRQREITALREMLLPGRGMRLVTLTGPGGTGKTRLALAIAERLVEPFQGAVWFASLADLRDPEALPDALLGALRLTRAPGREPLDQVVDALGAQPSLLLLDNLEQITEGGAEVARSLLERAPELTLLVTSRRVLGLSAEREFALSPLPTPTSDGGEDAEGLSAYDSVRLFIDRAQQVKPDFQVTNNNAAAVAELVSRLEGIPLAIELAAARALVLTPSQMLAQMEDRFAFLSGRKRDVAERQRTLRGAIDWSYRLLSPELQRFFCRLSVFRGGWAAEAAEAVCEEPLALDYLALLGECSLVLSEETEQGMRFRMLETLREFGQEHLAEEEKAANRRRHALFFGHQAKDWHERQTVWGREYEQWARTEYENLRQAIAWSLDSPADADLAATLVHVLANYRDSYGYHAESLRDLERALDREERMSPRVRCYARYFHAWLFERKGMWNWSTGAADRERSLELMARVLEIAREAGETRVQAMALNKLGRDDEALPLFEEIGDRWGIATALRDTAFRLYKGDPCGAEALYERVLAINREDGDTASIIHTLDQMGVARESVGDLAGARAAFEEGLRLRGPDGAPDGLAFILPQVARIALRQGDHGAARAYAGRLLALRWPAGETGRRMEALRFAATTFRDAGDAEAARPLLEEYLAQSRAEGDEGRTAWALGALGVLGEMGG